MDYSTNVHAYNEWGGVLHAALLYRYIASTLRHYTQLRSPIWFSRHDCISRAQNVSGRSQVQVCEVIKHYYYS